MEGKFTFPNIIELKNLRPLSENSAHKKKCDINAIHGSKYSSLFIWQYITHL